MLSIRRFSDSFAMMMVNCLGQYYVPLYTVHDNFITPYPFSIFVSDYYSLIITKYVQSPIYYVNRFIIHNLLVEPRKVQFNENQLTKTIHLERLKLYLEDLIPKNVGISKRNK